MSDSYEYVKVDIAMEVDYPASPGTEAPDTPKEAYVSYVIDTPGAKPGEEGLYDGYEVTSVPASSREVVEWVGAYRQFGTEIQMAHLELQVAEQAWRQAKEQWRNQILTAVAGYAPVNEEIEGRKAMVEAQDAYLDEMERKGKKVIEAAALEAEDAVLGNRSWVLYLRSGGMKTLHHVLCPRYANPPTLSRWSDPIRVADARKALLQGNVTACKRCKAEEHVRNAPERTVPSIPQQRQA